MEKIDKAIEILVNPIFLFVFLVVVMLIGRLLFGKRTIDCTSIIERHISCILNERHGKYVFTLFFVVPLILALALAKVSIINDNVINIITIIMSILTSMFFTLLTLVLDMKTRVKEDKRKSASDAAIMANILKETYYSIMFEILVCVLLLICCFLNIFSSKYSYGKSVLIYYMTLVILMNLFMILKRIFKTIENTMR